MSHQIHQIRTPEENTLKLQLAEPYRMTPLQDLSRISPGHKVLCFGRVVDKSPKNDAVTLQDHSGTVKLTFSPIPPDVETKTLSTDKIVKLYLLTNAKGFEVKKIHLWKVSLEETTKYFLFSSKSQTKIK